MSNALRIIDDTFEVSRKSSKAPVDNIIQLHKKKISETLDYRSREDFMDLESKNKGIVLNYDTISATFSKYPQLTMDKFKSYFFEGYNKAILQSSPEILDLIDLNEISPGDDIIEHVISKIALSEEEFREKTKGKLQVMTFPNMSEMSISQAYFYKKISHNLPGTDIIFGDNPKIKDNKGINQLETDSVGFIDMMGKGMFNTCIFKLLKTEPDEKKLSELNELFEGVEKDIFIGGSTSHIPFKMPENLQDLTFPKTVGTGGGIKLEKNLVLNSMGYLNSAYYATKSKAAFVFGSHNIAEPLHAGKLTVISNDPKNRYNHNWLVSYFGEKANLLSITEGNREEQQKEVDEFLQISQEELKERYLKFADTYEKKIKPLVYGIFYNYLKNSFPEKFI